jgi:hypothetical protein
MKSRGSGGPVGFPQMLERGASGGATRVLYLTSFFFKLI